MKIELVFTRTDGKKISIPFSKRDIRDLYDLTYIIDPETWKLNKIQLNTNKMAFAVHDVMDEGAVYSTKGTYKKKGKKKYHWEKEIHYLVKKPKWR